VGTITGNVAEFVAADEPSLVTGYLPKIKVGESGRPMYRTTDGRMIRLTSDGDVRMYAGDVADLPDDWDLEEHLYETPEAAEAALDKFFVALKVDIAFAETGLQ